MAKIHRHEGEKITVEYDVKRCIHAAECVHGLPAVFDPQRKPWIDPNGAGPDAVAAVIARCPSGALHYTRQDGGPAEAIPDHNTVTVDANGPLYARGKLEVMAADGSVMLSDTRVALCRCGASRTKPFCDGSHAKAGFQDSGALGQNVAKTVPAEAGDGTLRINPLAKGPLGVKGAVELVSADGQTRYQANEMYLCRCGASNNKPFCDGSHKRIGFDDTAADV